ncbi:Ig-like domain-containing protein [Undibacterium seohonense]|uniref:Ig-like domain-containing protein n=1 Tax=Undibacterium seohonense TaxID=1344950 RepID=A0ABR6X1K8_9BURK|nr:Ig-like domain-containing protein [Undibacterium seohonense]MBC3806548.1 Ig-like domain-containing protein [Undibacterium seohonense]
MTIQSYFSKPSAWLPSWLTTWLPIFLIAALSTACGGSGDQGREPILGLPAANLVALNVSPANSSIQIGGIQQFVATASFADGSSRVVSSESSWTSSIAANASISNAGLAQGIVAGSTTITAKYADKTATANLTVISVNLVSIAVTPTNPTVPVGNQQIFKAIGTYSNGTSTDISAITTFSVSNPAIASISASGTATAVSVGATPVVARSGSVSGTTNLNVSPAVLMQLSMAPLNPSVQVGATQALVVTASYSDGSTMNVSANSTYVAATTSVVSVVANTGVVTGLTTGNSVVTATFNGKTISTTVTVTPAQLVSIAVTPASALINIAATQNFVATATYSDGSKANISNTVIWTSSDISKATVLSGGTATGLAVGSSNIAATFQSKSGSALLTVMSAPVITGVTVTPATNTVVAGSSRNFIATATYSDNSTLNITNTANWSSAQPFTATVSPNGLAIGVSAGLATIVAKADGFTGSAELTVTPLLVMTAITVTPSNSSATVGANLQFTATAVFDDLSTQNISDTVVWNSTNPAVATISNSAPKGLASTFVVGNTTITATQGSLSGGTNFTVTAALITGINLRSAESFAVLAGNSITNNSGGLTLITGDIGSPSQTVDPVQTAGYTNYKSGAILATALADVQTAIADANARSCDVNSAAGINLGGQTLPPGVYCYADAITITGTFTMNGPGLYVFRTGSTLDSSSNSIVALNGGASAANVFWVPIAPTTLGANSAFIGTIMTSSAAITMGDMATLQNGRVLSASAVTLRNNVITL